MKYMLQPAYMQAMLINLLDTLTSKFKANIIIKQFAIECFYASNKHYRVIAAHAGVGSFSLDQILDLAYIRFKCELL